MALHSDRSITASAAAWNQPPPTRTRQLPTLAARLLDFDRLREYDLSSLKRMHCGGGKSQPELIKAVREKLDCAYFNGYAMWSYFTVPFSLTLPGVRVGEIEPIVENGQTWQGLEVIMPDDIATHSRIQKFYFGDDFLLRRQDYTLDVAGGANVANYASDIVKIAMLHVEEEFKREKLSARMLMQVHDELLVEASLEETPRVVEILRKEMESAVELDVPLVVDVGVGDNWMDAKP